MPHWPPQESDRVLTRRAWLSVAAALAPSLALGQKAAPSPEEQAVRAQARKAGVKPITARSSAQYLVIGDAPGAFQAEAMRICDGLAKDFLEHFKKKAFEVQSPKERLTVVALSGPKAYAAFLGLAQNEAVGGEYDPESNRLVIFDNRGRKNAGALVRKANTLALIHEATHQLTFNTGLLDRAKDVPECISEGLAMYAEVRGRDGSTHTIGDINVERLEQLPGHGQNGGAWFSTEKLLTKRELLESPETAQQAYAESWLLVHYLISAKLEPFQAYLATLRTRADAKHRVEDARKAFGDLKELDGALIAHAETLRKQGE